MLFQQIEDAVVFAAAGQTPYSPEQVLNIAYQLIFRTGIFADDCKTWKRRPAPYKTWAQFKFDFKISYQEYSESRELSPGASGFGAEAPTTHQDETIDAIANLATATAADRTAVANLMTTNAILTKEVAKVNEKLIAALLQVNVLTKQLATNRSTPDLAVSSGPVHYCWTCGYCCLHASHNCPNPAAGHKKTAIRRETMGGSNKNKPR